MGTAVYAANAIDKDSGKNKIIRYRLASVDASKRGTASNLFSIDEMSGHLTLLRHLDYETAQKHTLIVTATDLGEPPLQSNQQIVVEVQDCNDNKPIFQSMEYSVNVLESMPINSQVCRRHSHVTRTANASEMNLSFSPSHFALTDHSSVRDRH